MSIIQKIPLTDSIITAVAELINDAQKVKREPSHSDLDFLISKAGLSGEDPVNQGMTVGKAKRVREVLYWAYENKSSAGEILAYRILSTVKGKGGFRETSKNFVGREAIENLSQSLKSEGIILTSDGDIHLVNLDNLSAREMKEALKSYVRRAQKGNEDAALLAGTGKDLLEAVAAHVISEKTGGYSTQSNFPTLLGQAFTWLGLATSHGEPVPNEPVQKKFERALFELAISVNKVRNKEGTGHGRPFLASISDIEARAAVESMGLVAEFLLNKLEE